ncbi:formimidoylglutamate deiminase [uncultured Microscilla sp.]|uniref:formimidoylglutamate deiminase n=1 Tax=uncultured Microscilla sp. TaxID=432653 RepID=UPI002614BA42|nr:formimidoylglutamate deiminase [uncultured Microscilla sp.]
MKHFQFKALYQNNEWIAPAYVSVDQEGKITHLSATPPDSVTNIEKVDGYVLPGFQNAHSHAFQYAMAGIAERHSGTANPDDFWSWRNAMYQLALSVQPEQMEAIAAMLYAEMVRHGYTSVAEFHYVHHDLAGKPYNNKAAMGERLMAAAQKAGIRITLVPIFYQKGGFGQAPTQGQRRFISPDMDSYLDLLEQSQKAARPYAQASVGAGIHSLRAVAPEVIKATCENLPTDIPIHIHVAEQLKEIEDAKAYLGARPVEWLLNNLALNENYHLVHATHLTEAEVSGLAKKRANVVICPSTEGNLGDGLFPLASFQAQDGQWSIGTDSHIGLNPLEELRWLDYGQRVTTHKRNSFYSPQQTDSGRYALAMATFAGRRAMGHHTSEFFQVGDHFDAVVMDANFPLFAITSLDNLLSTIVYAGDCSATLGTIVNGRWIVQQQRHHAYQDIVADFKQVIASLEYR